MTCIIKVIESNTELIKIIINVMTGIISLGFGFYKWHTMRVEKKKEKEDKYKEKCKKDAQIAAIIYESITEIEHYIKHDRSSANIYVSPNWEESLKKCDFLTTEERGLVRNIHIEAEKFYDDWEKRNENGIYRRKEDIPSYQELQKKFFERYYNNIYNTDKHTKEYDNLLKKLEKCISENKS